jgi:hypothetical protein
VRQRFQTQEQSASRYTLPRAVAATGTVQETVAVATAPKATTRQQRAKVKIKTLAFPRMRFVVLALLGIFAFPWMPLKEPTAIVVSKGSANALYQSNAQKYNVELAKAREAERLDTSASSVGHRLPPALMDPSSFTTIEQARQNRDQFKHHLAVLKKGLTLPMQEVTWDVRAPHEPSPLNFVYLRELARLSVRDGNLKQLDGNYAGAMMAYLDAYALGVQVGHAAALVSGMIGALCQGMACVPAEVAVPHLTAAQARAAAVRMETIQAQQLSFAELLAGETRVVEPENLIHGVPSLVKMPVWGQVPAVQLANSYLMARYKEAMQQAASKAQQPYQKLGGVILVQQAPFDPATLLGSNDLPNVNRAYASFCSREALGRRLLLGLALRTWQAEHNGVFPTNLAALVEAGYLKKLPTDPFSHSGQESFHYDSKTGKVWSVGPDGVDAHGTGDDTTLMKA